VSAPVVPVLEVGGSNVIHVKLHDHPTDASLAASVQVPSGYRSGSSALDVRVVLMGQDLTASPVPVLLSRDARVGERAVIAGRRQNYASVSGVLLAGTASTVIQASSTMGSNASGVCFGDSGGPTLVTEGSTWVQADVTSFILGLVPNVARKRPRPQSLRNLVPAPTSDPAG